MIVNLTPAELICAISLAEAISINKLHIPDKIYDKNQNSFGTHYFGLLGEIAVARILNLKVSDSILALGDGGIDLNYRGQSIQIKTVNSYKERFIYFNNINDFNADWIIGCSLINPSTIEIMGFASHGKFIKNMMVKNFGKGDRYSLSENQLTSIEKINEAIP